MKKKKLTREQQKARRNMEKTFNEAFKQASKAAKWGYLKPTAFKRFDDWFIDLDPMIWMDEERAELNANVKPFAIDDLINRILGGDGLDRAPLSLRARGPHCLVLPLLTTSIESRLGASEMPRLSLEFREKAELCVSKLSIDDFIAFLHTSMPNGQASDNVVATLVLADRPAEALSICETAIAEKQWGSNGRMTSDGRIISFFELARRWLQATPQNKFRT